MYLPPTTPQNSANQTHHTVSLVPHNSQLTTQPLEQISLSVENRNASRPNNQTLYKETKICQMIKELKLSFNGKRKQDVEIFITKLQRFQHKFDIADIDMLHLHDVHLTDDAEVWSGSIADFWLDMNDLFADLRLQYSIPDLQIHLEDDIRNRTQAPEKAISQYTPKIRTLLDKLSPRLPMQIQLDRVYRNLHPDYQRAFKREDFTSFEEL